MTSKQFAGWLQFMLDEPFGGPREDKRAGVVVEAICNMSGRTLKRQVARWWDAFPEHAPTRGLRGDEPDHVRAMLARGLAIGNSLGFGPAPKGRK